MTLVSGFDRARKQRFITRALAAAPGDIAVITTEALEGDPNAHSITRLDGGCSCCSSRQAAVDAADALAREGSAKRLLLDVSASASSLITARAFLTPSSDGAPRSVFIDDLVACLDAPSLLSTIDAAAALSLQTEIEGQALQSIERLFDQIESATTLQVDDLDALPHDARARVDALLSALNPSTQRGPSTAAQRLPTTLGTLGHGAGWLRSIRGDADALSASPWHVFKAWRPFHPERLFEALTEGLDGVIRAKGFVWVATQMQRVGSWTQIGAHARLQPAGRWWATREDGAASANAELRARWREPYGDRRQELAFFTDEATATALFERLRGCLLSDEEMTYGQLGWRYFPDPLAGLRWASLKGRVV